MKKTEKEIAKFYKRKQIESATPGQLVLLLYDGAIDFLNRAEAALLLKTPDRFEKYHNSLISCQNIITELIASLDLERGGEIANNLFRLYDFMNYRLVDANISKELTPVKEVRGLLNELRSAWVKVLEKEPTLKNMPQAEKGLNLQG